MGVTVYAPAPFPDDEEARERAVLASGALEARNDSVLQELVTNARRKLDADMAAVSILSRDWQYLIAATGITSRTYSRRMSLCGHAIITPRAVFCVEDARADPRFADNPVLIDGGQVRFYAGAPLVDAGHMPLGTFCVFDRRPRTGFGAYEQMHLKQLADAVIVRLAALRAG
ncbi:GAF domain-containing protein [Sphingomonas sp. BE138]|uniref:GAF domain-containing protein n=1 Tax=Sphingomonas sp. BE138 TaxID=2817845 RepID=UPI00285BACA9|nr:GAF domain-containing protein [Sphingomonas sp. BE138]MDR6787905.1 GAF domain-containing protein [Sphingomonas sp. BE138]